MATNPYRLLVAHPQKLCIKKVSYTIALTMEEFCAVRLIEADDAEGPRSVELEIKSSSNLHQIAIWYESVDDNDHVDAHAVKRPAFHVMWDVLRAAHGDRKLLWNFVRALLFQSSKKTTVPPRIVFKNMATGQEFENADMYEAALYKTTGAVKKLQRTHTMSAESPKAYTTRAAFINALAAVRRSGDALPAEILDEKSLRAAVLRWFRKNDPLREQRVIGGKDTAVHTREPTAPLLLKPEQEHYVVAHMKDRIVNTQLSHVRLAGLQQLITSHELLQSQVHVMEKRIKLLTEQKRELEEHLQAALNETATVVGDDGDDANAAIDCVCGDV